MAAVERVKHVGPWRSAFEQIGARLDATVVAFDASEDSKKKREADDPSALERIGCRVKARVLGNDDTYRCACRRATRDSAQHDERCERESSHPSDPSGVSSSRCKSIAATNESTSPFRPRVEPPISRTARSAPAVEYRSS